MHRWYRAGKVSGAVDPYRSERKEWSDDIDLWPSRICYYNVHNEFSMCSQVGIHGKTNHSLHATGATRLFAANIHHYQSIYLRSAIDFKSRKKDCAALQNPHG